MKYGTWIKLVKQQGIPAHQGAAYADGTVQAIERGYEVVGRLTADVGVGEPLQMFRTERNGVASLGHFTTSSIEVIWWDSLTEATLLTESGSEWAMCAVDAPANAAVRLVAAPVEPVSASAKEVR